MEKRPALGKGLSALIPDVPEVRTGGSPTEVDVDQISPNEHQPRHRFEDARLDELAQSIKANGVIQPIVVRKVDGGYRIIAGERRWRAAQRAGLTRVPVVIKEIAARKRCAVARDGAHREHPARRPQSDRPGRGVRKAEQRLQHDAGRDRRRRGQGPFVGRQSHAAVEASAGSARRSRGGAAVDGARARAYRASRTKASQRQIAREVIARNLSVRETEAMVKRIGARFARRRAARSGRDRRAYASCGREAAHDARHPRAHQSQRQRRPNRDRFRVRGRVTAFVRAFDVVGRANGRHFVV